MRKPSDINVLIAREHSGALAKAVSEVSLPHYVVTSFAINGDLEPVVATFTDLGAAKKHADWMFNHPGWRSVEITAPLAVRLVSNGGRTVVEAAPDMKTASEVLRSWQGVLKNRKVTGHPARAVDIVNIPKNAAHKPTQEDIAMGSWLAAALEDPKVCPSMKFDINAWMDSKIWT